MREKPLASFIAGRHSLPGIAAALALIVAPALLVLPKGLSAFGALVFVLTVMLLYRSNPAPKETAATLVPVLLAVILALAVALFSTHSTGQGWRAVDNISRLLLLPWCAWIACKVAPSRTWLWVGAMIGVGIAFVLATIQAMSGVERAGAGSNPIVFANAVLALLVLVVFCRPATNHWRVLLPVVLMLVLGTIAIVLSGSRGVLPGLALIVLVATLRSGRKLWLRLGVAAGFLVLSLMVLWTVPSLSQQTRLEYVLTDVQNYLRGNVDSPIGARLEFLEMSAKAFAQHPWTGVGIDRFHSVVAQIPVCQQQNLGVCQLGHAHNDLAEWAATMGLPGLIAILLLYLVPGGMFIRFIRRSATKPVGAAWAGVMLVSVYFLSGLTQSMFAHALSATTYAVFVGLLLGIAFREQRFSVS